MWENTIWISIYFSKWCWTAIALKAFLAIWGPSADSGAAVWSRNLIELIQGSWSSDCWTVWDELQKTFELLSNFVSLFETLPLSLLGLSLLTDLFMVKALCFDMVKEFTHSVWFDMITLLLKKLHASEITRLIVEEEWRVKVMSDINSFVPTSNLPQF